MKPGPERKTARPGTRRLWGRLAALALLVDLGVAPAVAVAADAAPTGRFDWGAGAPESQGMSSQKLGALRESLAARKTQALLVIRDDTIVAEWYAPGHTGARTHYTASMAKAIVGGVSLAVALNDGLIALDDPVAKFVPQWKDDPRRSRITIRELGSHTSGVADAEADGKRHEELTGWQGDFWKRLDPPHDPFTIARDLAPVLFEPGTDRQYSNPGIAMLTYAVTAALRDAPVKDIRTVLRDRIMRPIGVPDEEWGCGYGQTFTVDGLPLVGAWGGGNYTARAVARIGRLMLRQGDWEGKRLLSRAAVRQTTSSAGLPGAGGMGWWTNDAGRCPKLPTDAFWGSGAGGQVVLVVPSLKLIAVRNGAQLDDQDNQRAINTFLFDPLMAVFLDPGLPPAPGPRS
jgi:CubicO group peptidase (beta-lactamase class C family)